MKVNPAARRVLVYRLGSLGDTIVSLPCLHLIERSFPHSERVLLTNFPVHSKAPAAASVIGESGLIHGYMRYAMATRNPFELAKLWWKLVRFRPDVLVYLMPARTPRALRRDELFFRSAGIREIVGLSAAATSVHIVNEQTGQFEREASRLSRLVAELGDAAPELISNWDLRLTTGEKETALRALASVAGQPLLMCGPGTKMQAKDWGAENWQSLLQKLSGQLPHYALVLVGANEDAATADSVSAQFPGKTLNLCGRLSPRETAAVISHGDLFLGPDSGPMHLAAAVGVPCVIAFSARGKPGIWFPVGDQHHVVYHKTDCFGCNLEVCIDRRKECLTSITTDEMLRASLSALGVRSQTI